MPAGVYAYACPPADIGEHIWPHGRPSDRVVIDEDINFNAATAKIQGLCREIDEAIGALRCLRAVEVWVRCWYLANHCPARLRQGRWVVLEG